VEVSGAEDGGEEEEDADARVQGQGDAAVEEDLGEGADEGQGVSDQVELAQLCALGKDAADAADEGVDADVEPASDGIFGVVFPGLKAIAVG
jgi:hypothetical protein